ncbi:hypothetical protein [Paracoccus sp. IB05]|uniref:hypothetical protein n=1 Tax=Paracoccus sp. IB05 TaxID=2779367 RepID=UPI0018E7787A|nr:hypothetical protein [Paracoccus sp. IB05]MBJ2151758.1 hypothetical protein [Paracoccus sp. IB05]
MIRCLALLCAVAVSPAPSAARPFDATALTTWSGPRALALVRSGADGFEVNTDTIRSKVQSGAMLPDYEVSPT